ncbi:MAG: tetratricopeptide repeat protein [Pyrinomonadaceae bacterium]
MSEHFISRADAVSDLLSCAAYLAERITNRDGHSDAISAVVPLYLADGNVDLAAELANSVDDPFTRDRLLTLVAERCAAADDDEYALQLAEAIEDAGIAAQALETIALQKAAKGQLDRASEIAEQIEHPDYVFAAVATRLAADGRDAEADEMLERVEYIAARVSALQSIAAECQASDAERSVAYLERAVHEAAGIEHDEERIRAFVEIGNHLVEFGRSDLAIDAYDKARASAEQLDNMHRDSFLAAAALGFLHAGSLDLAERTLDLVTDKTQLASALVGYAREFWKKGERDDAIESLDEAYQILRSQRESETRSAKARFQLFATIAAQLAAFGRAERAIEIAQSIEDPVESTAALSQIAAILASLGSDDLARQALDSIADEDSRAFALIGMSDAKAKAGDREAAIKLLDEAEELVVSVPQPASRSSAYIEIARRWSHYGETEKASSAAHFALETTAAIRDESRRAVALAELAGHLRQSGASLSEPDRKIVEQIAARANL